MTAQTAPGTGEDAVGPPASAQDAAAPVPSPAEAAARSIEEARAVLAEAAADVATGDADRVAHGLELTAGCADHIARALWFLRRAEREQEPK